MSYREFWHALGIPDYLFVFAGLLCGALLLSVLLPIFSRPLDAENLRKRLAALVLVFLWTAPNLFLSVTQRPIPHLEKLGFRQSTGILFSSFQDSWKVHHFEFRSSEQAGWETIPDSYFFNSELPLGGSRLEAFMIYASKYGSVDGGKRIIDLLMNQISDRVKSDDIRFNKACALRLVAREYSPLSSPPMTKAFRSDALEGDWRLSEVLAERKLGDEC